MDSQQEDWQKKTATTSLFRQIVSHVAFVIITIAIILQHQDIDAFYMTQEVHNMFLGPEKEFTEVSLMRIFFSFFYCYVCTLFHSNIRFYNFNNFFCR